MVEEKSLPDSPAVLAVSKLLLLAEQNEQRWDNEKRKNEAIALENTKLKAMVENEVIERDPRLLEKLLDIYCRFLAVYKITKDQIISMQKRNLDGMKSKKIQFSRTEEATHNAIVQLLAYQYAVNKRYALPPFRKRLVDALNSTDKQDGFHFFINELNKRYCGQPNLKVPVDSKAMIESVTRNWVRKFTDKLRNGVWSVKQSQIYNKTFDGVYLQHVLFVDEVSPKILEGREVTAFHEDKIVFGKKIGGGVCKRKDCKPDDEDSDGRTEPAKNHAQTGNYLVI